jgi:hypothetical protein
VCDHGCCASFSFSFMGVFFFALAFFTSSHSLLLGDGVSA